MRWLLLFYLLSLSLALALSDEIYPRPKGLYVLLYASQTPREELLVEDFTDGISVRVRWMDVEPEPQRFNWRYLDGIFNLAERHNKKVYLRLLGGFWAPKWIYSKGVPSFELELLRGGPAFSSFKRTYGSRVRLPVVWSSKYLHYWSRFVSAVGERYSNREALILVHLSGPTFFSAEPILARDSEELRLLREVGFNEVKVLEAWRVCSQNFKDAFPRQYLALNLHYVVKGDIWLTERLLEEVKGVLGPRLVVQGNWLKLPLDEEEKPLLKLLLNFKRRGGIVGFQFAAPLTRSVREVNKANLRGKLEILLRQLNYWRVDYLEVYQLDLRWKPLKKFWRLYRNFDS